MSIEPVRKQLVVNASQEHCFKVFTAGIDRWWPREHHIGASPMKQVIIEPRAGGRWYATCQDGSECDTGKVLTWDPPRRLVLSWQITATWQFDPAFVTEVEVQFVEQAPKKTLVTFEHRNLDRYGEKAAEIKTSIGSADGWPKTIDTFARVAEEG
jgi:uncharacterized protein YndB with AHSA1/START domain